MSAHFLSPLLLTVLGSGMSLAALWLRLWWRTRQEQAHRKTLVTLARSMPPGSRLEERHTDGTTLLFTVDTVGFASSTKRPMQREQR